MRKQINHQVLVSGVYNFYIDYNFFKGITAYFTVSLGIIL